MEEKKDNRWDLGLDALYLAGCALRGQTPRWDAKKDLEPLFRFCKFHTVTAIVAMALDSFWSTCPAEDGVRQQWKQVRDQAIRKNLLLNTERQAIVAHLEKMGCRYMPLKGSLLQFDYPKFGMRQMTDNDILIDSGKRTQIHEFLTGRGYTTGFYLQNEVDTYQKPPVYNFEMHTSLFSRIEGEKLAAYYRDIWRRTVKDPDNRWGYHLTDEDFYIYMVAHAYKHLINGGIGIRNLLDIHVYLQKHKEMDLCYVNRELKKLEALEFEQMCRGLCRKLLEGDPYQAELTEQEKRIMVSFFTSGTFGTSEQRFVNKFRRLQKDGGKISLGTKLKYAFRRLFPPMELLRVDYPDIDRKRWKIPFILLWRAIRCLIHPVRTFREIRQISKVDEQS